MSETAVTGGTTAQVMDDQVVQLLAVQEPFENGTGWLRDWPDFRDFTPEHPEIAAMVEPLRVADGGAADAIPATVDLRPWFSPVEDQGQLGSCTANAGVGILEYFERRASGTHIDASRLFLYKVTRDLLGWTGDTGAMVRTTMGAMAMFGVAPEKYAKYVIAEFDKEPPAFLYAFAKNYQALKYFRLDAGLTGQALVDRIKTYLAAGIPSMFGFTVYSSISQAAKTGAIPLPTPGEKVLGGHAICTAGYDDTKVIKNVPSGLTTTGAFRIRNSWGTGWGESGYGWIPYEYVIRGIASDWWSLLQASWVNSGQFGI
jgi:C1A family cysteine protease